MSRVAVRWSVLSCLLVLEACILNPHPVPPEEIDIPGFGGSTG